MLFIETHIFTEDVQELLGEEEYRQFQNYLAQNPETGPVIVGTGGLRKLRWSSAGTGKRGGVRVIYYYLASAAQIRLLLVYKKGVQDTLTPKQKGLLRKMNEDWR